jgi:nicotinamide-nucleotide amidase
MPDYQELIHECSDKIARKKLSIAFAESATAGKLAFEFSLAPHSGAILKGGIVCYDACIKEDVLGIPQQLIAEYTPESAEVTKAMAVSVKQMMGADITVAVTGLTTPGGSEQPGKPVGTMFYCILFKDLVLERKKIFTGSPIDIINLTIEQIAKTLLLELQTKNDDNE